MRYSIKNQNTHAMLICCNAYLGSSEMVLANTPRTMVMATVRPTRQKIADKTTF